MRSRQRTDPHLLLLTPGDPEGIGPEIAWKTLRLKRYSRNPSYRLVCVGALQGFRKLGIAKRVTMIDPSRLERRSELPSGQLLLIPAPEKAPGIRRLLAGYQSGWSVELATRLCLSGKADALITGPISKERLQAGGYPFSGHTDLLASLCGRRQVTMMLANDQLRITLATVHIGLSQVPRELSRARLRVTIQQTVRHLRDWWTLRRPRVAIAALNPHAGENGLFGDEERTIIAPAIRAFRRSAEGNDAILSGPLPADTLFANHLLAPPEKRFDAVVCMYHDQGLIPVKLLDFRSTVNVTLGLPIIRTSVDHGVAFDIAGRDLADPSSLQAAIDLASEVARLRTKREE